MIKRTIPKWKLEDFFNQISKFNQKATKRGLPILTYELGDSYVQNTYVKFPGDECESPITIKVQDVSISNSFPILIGGWNLVGVIKPDIIISYKYEYMKTIKREDVDMTHCDHCNITRNRTSIWILEKDGLYKYVGSTCVQDFTGTPIANFNWFNKQYQDFMDYLGGNHKPNFPMFSTKRFLNIAYNVIQEMGWISSQKAEYEYKTSTKTILESILLAPKDSVKKWEEQDNSSKIHNVLKWVSDLDPKNNYEVSLKATFDKEWISQKEIGIAASVFASYEYHLRKEETTVNQKKSEYIGQEKDRIILKLQLQKLIEFDSFYGTTFLHIFYDEADNKVVWFGSKPLEMEVEKWANVKCTIKKHEVYDGTKQTVVNRCVVVS